MTTFSIVVVPAKVLSDGRHRIRIAVAHKRQTRYIVTPFILDSLSQFRNGRVVRHEHADQINSHLRKKVDDYIRLAASLDDAQGLTCTELIHFLREAQRRKQMTLMLLTEEYLERLEREGQSKSYLLYQTALARACRYLGGNLPLGRLGPADICRYTDYLEQEKLSSTTIRIYLTLLRVVVNYAVKMNYVNYPVHPFAVCRLPVAHVRELDLTVEELKRLRDLPLRTRNLIQTRDLFMLTYYLGGMNLRDLLVYPFEEGNDVLRYVRHKTGGRKTGENEIVFTIQPEARTLIRKYMGTAGLLRFGKNGSYATIYNMVYRNLPRLAHLAGITSRLSYYSARKSFAQHGYDAGIQMETIEYCIGHSMKRNRPVCNYIRIMQAHADVAMRKIFDRLL